MRNYVVVANAPNELTDGRTSGSGFEHSDWANYPHLGVLKLCSSLKVVDGIEPVYFDGTVRPIDDLLEFISCYSERILLVGVSVLTASYGAGLQIARHAKEVDPRIKTILGNDHFTACYRTCLMNRPEIDGGFVGNEVFAGFISLVSDLRDGLLRNDYPGYVTRETVNDVVSSPEPVFGKVDYRLIDKCFTHSDRYRRNFQARVAPRIHALTGLNVSAGVPIEFARGCLKFRGDDACSFCSIQYGGMWRNEMNAIDSWAMITDAERSGFDFLYLTTDEMALTFPKLLLEMVHLTPPSPPPMVAYARADGLACPNIAQRLADIGVRFVMVGFDAGMPISLQRLNKPLRGNASSGEQLLEQNYRAIDEANHAGIWIRGGLVVGHIGIDGELLGQNVEAAKALLAHGSKALMSLDVEVLSPEPGSVEFRMLTDPQFAVERCRSFGIEPPSVGWLQRAQRKWGECDLVDREDAMRDYVEGFMKGVSFQDLSDSRRELRNFAKSEGVLIGEVGV